MQTLTSRELRNLPKVRKLLKEQGSITVTNNGIAEFVLTPPPSAFKIPDFAARIKADLGGRYRRKNLAAVLTEEA